MPGRVYKCWIEIERFDPETEEWAQVTQGGTKDGDFAEPVPIGEFKTLDEAVAFAEGMADE